jgi:hypothetical protein
MTMRQIEGSEQSENSFKLHEVHGPESQRDDRKPQMRN